MRGDDFLDDLRCHSARDLGLNHKYRFQLSIEGLAPDLQPLPVQQARSNSNKIIVSTNAAVQQVFDAQLLANLCRAFFAVAECK